MRFASFSVALPSVAQRPVFTSFTCWSTISGVRRLTAPARSSGPHGVGLPPQYSLFGKLIDGLDVLDTLQKV